jgi:heme-degrading monooxygenase HmoA
MKFKYIIKKIVGDDSLTYVLVIHRVEDYAKWKPIYDEDGATRKAKGSKGAKVLRNANDPNHLVVITEWEDLQKAKNFIESDDIANTMKKAGVVGKPAVFYLEELEKTPY